LGVEPTQTVIKFSWSRCNNNIPFLGLDAIGSQSTNVQTTITYQSKVCYTKLAIPQFFQILYNPKTIKLSLVFDTRRVT
jgi:hypothetical protein